jgi:hypothetical protein
MENCCLIGSPKRRNGHRKIGSTRIRNGEETTMISLKSAITVGLVIVAPPNADRSLASWFKSLRLPSTGNEGAKCCDVANLPQLSATARWRALSGVPRGPLTDHAVGGREAPATRLLTSSVSAPSAEHQGCWHERP